MSTARPTHTPAHTATHTATSAPSAPGHADPAAPSSGLLLTIGLALALALWGMYYAVTRGRRRG